MISVAIRGFGVFFIGFVDKKMQNITNDYSLNMELSPILPRLARQLKSYFVTDPQGITLHTTNDN